jgi:hypothetical protein
MQVSPRAKAFGCLALYTIFQRPTDFPDHYVVRRFYLIRGEIEPSPDPIGCLCKSLEEARRQVPERINHSHRANLFREATDDPQIVETWI